MLFGAHVSIAGGIPNAPANAAAIGCEVFQMFTRSPQGGTVPKLTKEIISHFRKQCDAYKQEAWYVHAPYYINLASANPVIRSSSIRVLREELERSDELGSHAMMTHIGSAKGNGSEEQALQIVIDGVQKILDGYSGRAMFLVEIAAGSGMIIGDTFEELAAIVEATKGRCGVCFDTQHAFGSGYDLRTSGAVKETFDRFDEIVGLEHLVMFHCNDSMVPFASHRDRHEHIGKGEIGLEGFRAILSDKRVAVLDFLCETPVEGAAEDIATLKRLRKKLQK